MHILHGSWLTREKVFALWGEDTGAEPQYRKGRRGAVAPHPFPLSIEDWLRYLDRFSTDSAPDGKIQAILLPGNGKKAQPSPEAQAAGMPSLDDELSLLAWEVDAVTLQPTELLDLMLQLPATPRGFVLGSDLIFWQQVALLAMNLLVEGRFVPTLAQQGSRYLAGWQARPDSDLQAQLAINMPPLCRALVDQVDKVSSPDALLNSFLDITVTSFVWELYDGKSRPRHRWLRALTDPDHVLSGSENENRQLYESWQTWQAVGSGAAGVFRVCFRLSEPQDGADVWPVEYLLQASDDPSLLVDAATVWTAKSDRLDYLEYRFQHPQEKLLAALGVASRIFPPIERSLRTNRPQDVLLTRDEAYIFLTSAAPMLETGGFSVLVPNWWGQRPRVKARARMKGKSAEPTGFLTHDALVSYSWEMSLDGERISRAEFEQLVALKQPLVRYKGQWITLDPDQVKAILQFFDQTEQVEGEVGLLEAMRLATTGDGTDLDGIEVESAEVDGWLNDVFERLSQPENAGIPEIPTGLKGELRPYQERGFGWLTQMQGMGLGACLADDMGLGKTPQTITLWLHEREQMDIKSPALLVCPTSVVGNWSHELARFAPSLRVMKHQNANRLKDEAFAKAVADVDVVLTSYALLHRDLETLQMVEWSSLVLDEAQNIKNPSTKQAQAARTLTAGYKLALTGTPIENRLSELWSIFQFLNPGYLGSQRAFKSTFSTPIERYGDEQAAVTLKKLTAPFILRRLKTDSNIIQDLPEKFENKVYCSLTAEQATLYEATVREEIEAIEQADDDMKRRGSVLRMLTRLKQICNHPAHFLKEGGAIQLADRSGKLARLVAMLDEVRDVDERALIFTQYAQMGTLLQGYLREYLVDEVLFLHGGTPPSKREEMVRMFQSSNGPPVFILSLKAGGTGLNLTNANHVFHFDRWYNPAVENQATDRAFRIGQTRNVQAHKFICLGTLEEKIDDLIEHKRELADSIVGAGENWLSELDDGELRDMVQLRYEAMEAE
jgi:SNF2 family DNA or RNA helicase